MKTNSSLDMRIHHNYRYILLGSASFIVALALWWIAAASKVVPKYFLPSPLNVIGATVQLFTTRIFLRDIGISVARIMIGFIAAVIFAIPTGMMIGLSRRAEAFMEPMIDFIRYTPIPAFIPLLILWFGIGEWEKMIVIASSVFFQLVLMIANSVSATPGHMIESARTLGATPWQILTHIIYPYAQPRIVDDLRISMGWAWSGLMLAEIVGSTSGIGYVIMQSQRLLQTAQVVSAIIIVGLLGIASDYCFKWFYAISFPWAPKIQNNASS